MFESWKYCSEEYTFELFLGRQLMSFLSLSLYIYICIFYNVRNRYMTLDFVMSSLTSTCRF